MLAVVAGRQIQTAERLEVLAMGLRSHVGEGQPLEKVISQVVDEGGIAIIPWGFGKWIGERGRYLRSLIRRSEKPPFLLGDNGNRVSWLRHPTEFDLAAQNGIHIIPGSDPLPFDRECNTVGRFGFVINEALDPTRPTEFLIGHLRRDDLVVQQFGELENPLRFVQNQVAMQLKRPRGTK